MISLARTTTVPSLHHAATVMEALIGDGVTCDKVDKCAARTDTCSENATYTNTVGIRLDTSEMVKTVPTHGVHTPRIQEGHFDLFSV